MTSPEARRIAHRRALTLGSVQFPPAAHVPYLEDHGPRVGVGLGRHEVGDLVIRDVDVIAERAEIIRVISETLIRYGQVGRHLSVDTQHRTPAGLLASELVWFGIEDAGRLNALHAGFFWSAGLWIRRIYAIVNDPYPWDVHFAIESHIYGHLWDLGMREAMIHIPVGTRNLEARHAGGWTDSHEAHYGGNARPFMWLRKRFAFQPAVHAPFAPDPAWQVET